MEQTKKRKLALKGLCIFVAGLVLLTFFSNTIMNMMIPKVIGAYPVRGNLSISNNSTGTIEASNSIKVKGIDGRVVKSFSAQEYWSVEAGETLVELEQVTDTTELDTLKDELTDLQRQLEYNQRQPSSGTHSGLHAGITQAELALDQARDTLSDSQNRNSVIAEANRTIQNKEALIRTLNADLEEATNNLEDLKEQMDAINIRINEINSQISELTNQGDANSTGEEGSGDESAQIDALNAELEDLLSEKSSIQSQITSTTNSINTKTTELAAANSALSSAQARLEEANSLPSVSEARAAVSIAQDGLNEARENLSNTEITDGIARDQARDEAIDLNKQIEDIEEKIATLEANMAVNSISAPISGTLYNINVSEGDELTSDAVLFEIVPENGKYCVTFDFESSAAKEIYVGMELSTDADWISKCEVTRISPNPEDPRNKSRIICDIEGNNIYPGESITVSVNKSNSTFDYVVPSSAVNEDNGGTFVYAIIETKSPLGNKYVVKRISVSTLATDGAMTAIEGDNLDGIMVVTRSEQPLCDGDRIRLEDYSGS